MTNFCSSYHLPRAGIDRIDDPRLALSLLGILLTAPAATETIALLLDDDRRGLSVLRVAGTRHADNVLSVAESVIERAHQHDDFGAVILASVRPGGSDQLDDLDRWLELCDLFEAIGVELVEWFVIGRATSCPRELFGEPPRWGL